MARTIDGRIVSKKVDGWDTEARHGYDVDQLHGYADETPRHSAPARQNEAPPRAPSAQTHPSPVHQRTSTPAGGSAVGDRPSPVHRRAEEILRALVGVPTARLHQDQWRAIEALVVGHRRVLVVQRTGWGKSAVYFVATVLLREGWGTWRPGDPPPRPGASSPNRPGAGPTVIVSPLLALMRDQVTAASRAGIHAVTMNSANATQWDQIQAQVRAGEVDVLLVSPERLNNPVFREEVLPHLAADAGLVVIDEAHCISDWGHDFRPDYRRIRTLLASLPPRTPVLATTATANARVTADVAEQLETSTGYQAPTTAHQAPTGRVKDTAPSAPAAGSTPVGGAAGEEAAGASRRYSTPTGGAAGSTSVGGDPAGPGVLVLRGSLQRDSLHLGVRILPDAATRLAWLAAYLQHVPGSGIVYCLTVAAAGEVTEHLRQAGLEVATYTGQTDPAEREHLEEDLKANRVKALVATSALSMGFDKPDLTFVVHVGAPSSPVSYYQQVGRAGRGVERAEVVLLPGREDRSIWEWFGSQGFPPEKEVRAVLEGMAARQAAGGGPMPTPALETLTSLRRARLESMLKVLDVDGAVRRVRGGWEPTGRPWVYDADRYARVEAARLAEQEAMVAYEHLGAEPLGTKRAGAVPRLGGALRPADDANRGGTGAGIGTVAGAGAGACRMAFLRQALDDPEVTEGWRCGACDLCGGLVLPQAPDAGQVGVARQALARTGVELRARRQWPTGMDRLGLARYRGRIGVDEQAGAGMALGRLDGLGISAPLRDLVLSGRDGEVPRALRAPFLEVVDRLGEVVRQADASGQADDEGRGPLAVVIVDSRTRPRLVRQLGRAVANRLRGRALGIVGVSGDEPPRHDVGSAFRLAQVARSLSLGAWSAAALGRLQGATVVLVDDWTGSGWTLTVATSLLRQAGAAAVHPLVLAQR